MHTGNNPHRVYTDTHDLNPGRLRVEGQKPLVHRWAKKGKRRQRTDRGQMPRAGTIPYKALRPVDQAKQFGTLRGQATFASPLCCHQAN